MDQLVNFIIRPPRAEYCPNDDLLDEEFTIGRRFYRRKDIEVTNGQGKKLQCSHYMPLILPEGQALPCVIYCHGNSGCRTDASEAAIILLPSNITVFALDFSGSGLSEGEHVTLGWNEKEDLRAVVNYLRKDENVSCIGLWGRSMGAVTSLMYGAEDPSIAGMVLDSPFSNLVELMMELVDTVKYPIPKFTVKLAIQHMRRIIKKKASFDIMDLETIEVSKRCFVPALFGHALDDDFIRPHHSDRIYESYVGDKNIIKFEGDHNSPRPQFYFDSVTIFFHNVLNPPSDASVSIYDQGRWDGLHDIYRLPQLSTANEFASTEDALLQLRSRRVMSRMEVPSGVSSEGNQGKNEQMTDGDLGPSSSMSAANPNGPDKRLPTPIEDGEYVEYTFDGSYCEPCTEEDEQRMLMEAILASLRDAAEIKQKPDPEEAIGGSSAVSEESSSLPNGVVSDKIATGHNDDPGSKEAAGMNNSTSSSNQSAPSSSEPGGSLQAANAADGTRATIVVEKTRSGTLIDGLSQKFGFGFFKKDEGR